MSSTLRTVAVKLLYSPTRCLTVVDFFKEFYKLKLNDCIYKLLVEAIVAKTWPPKHFSHLAHKMFVCPAQPLYDHWPPYNS